MAKRQLKIDNEYDEYSNTYSTTRTPTKTNTLRIKLDHLKTFDPLTENQKRFFDIKEAITLLHYMV